jgi:hypothetical protein
VVQYYYQERIAALNLVSAIFRASQDSDHPFHQEAKDLSKDLINAKLDSSNFKTNALDQLKDLFKKVPHHLVGNSNVAAAWAKQNLLEQKALISLIILLNYCQIPTANEAEQTMIGLIELQFGVQQFNRPYFDKGCLEIYRSICNLFSVLFVEMMNLDFVLSRIFRPLSADFSNQAVLDSPDITLNMHTRIWAAIESFPGESHEPSPKGVIAVAWACNTQLLMMILSKDCPDHYRELQNLLSQTHNESKCPQKLFQYGYLHGKFLEYVVEMFSPQSAFQLDPNELAYKSIMKGLLNTILITQNVSTLPSRSLLVESFCCIFRGNSEICNQFWNDDFQFDDYRSLLEATQRAFPIYFDDFCNLVHSLIADNDTADYAFQYLSKMPSLTDFARAKDYQQSFEQIDRTTVWDWTGNNLVVDTPNIPLIPPKYSKAYEMGRNVVLLKFEYSVWHLFLSLMDSFLHCSTAESEKNDCLFGTLTTTENILKIINAILQYADSSTRNDFLEHLGKCNGNLKIYGDNPVEALVGIVGEIMNRSCYSNNVDLDIITSCINIQQHLIHHSPEIIWKRLRVTRLLPQNAGSHAFNPGYIQQYVIPRECERGTYSVTISFLNLVKEMILEAQNMTNLQLRNDIRESAFEEIDWVKYDILYCCILFILRDLFPAYDSWRYEKVSQKFEIGLQIVSLFNAVMEDTTWYFMEECVESSDAKRVSNIQRILLDSLVYKPSVYQLAPLLDILSMGNLTPLEYHMFGRLKEAELIENSIIEALLLLRRFLVVLFHQENEVSGLELAILDRTCRLSNGTNSEFIQIIASYIEYKNNGHFAQLATEVLTLLCSLTSKNGKPPTSFVGYFGAEAFILVSKFIELVDDESKRAAFSDIVQMSVYNFVTAIIESQPGLGAMFLNGFEQKSIAQVKEDTDDTKINSCSILIPLTSTISKWKITCRNKPIVLASASNLLDSLWQKSKDHHATLRKLGKLDSFWNALIQIISEPDDNFDHNDDLSDLCYFKITQAHAVRILATEAFLFVRSCSHVSSEIGHLIIKTLTKIIFKEPFGQGKFLHDATKTEIMVEYSNEISPKVNLNFFRRLTWNDIYDAERLSGTSFIYNTELLARKLNLENNENIIPIAEKLLDQVEKVNINWSITDAHMVLVQASGFAVKLMTSQIWNSESVEAVKKVSLDDIFALSKRIISNFKKSTCQSFIHGVYKTEQSGIVFSLLSHWSREISIGKILDYKDQLLEILDDLSSSFLVSNFPLGPTGRFSEFPFHYNILSSTLLILQKLSNLKAADTTDRKKVDSIYKKILPIVCHGLYYILASQDHSNDQEEHLLLSSLFELIRVNTGASISIWLPIVEKFQIISLLLNAFASWQDVHNVANYANDPEHVLELLLTFSMHGSSSGPLVANGVIATLCNNFFTEKLVQGGVSPYEMSERSQIHNVWKLMISIVSELLNYIGNDRDFIESVVGFLRLYEAQIKSAFSVYRERNILSVGLLEELEKITGLYYRLSSSSDCKRMCGSADLGLAGPVISDILEIFLQTLALYVFLFKNPHELASRIQPFSKTEKLVTERFLQEEPSNQRNIRLSAIQIQVKGKMLLVVLKIVSFLRVVSQSESLLASSAMVQFPTLFAPTLTSFHDSGSTFGTLFDLIRHLTTVMKQIYDKEHLGPPSNYAKMLVCSLESTITLLSSQLMIYDEEKENDTINELRNEFQSTVSDLNYLFKDTVKLWKIDTINDAHDYMQQMANIFQPSKCDGNKS